jgi:hypothetical protein
METIGRRDFNYRKTMVTSRHVDHRIGGQLTKPQTMKNKLILAVIPGVIVPAALLLSFRTLITAEALVGYLSVLTLLGVAALEYRLNWKNLLGR